MQGYSIVRRYPLGCDSMPRPQGQGGALTAVSPTYFCVTGIRVRRGRLFISADGPGASTDPHRQQGDGKARVADRYCNCSRHSTSLGAVEPGGSTVASHWQIAPFGRNGHISSDA